MRFIDEKTGVDIPPATASFCAYIKHRIKSNKNFLTTITGATGSGKSYSALSLMELLNPDKSPEELMENVAFNPHEFISIVNNGKIKAGDVLIWEESGVGLSSKSWQSLANKSINYLLQTFRNMNLIVIFTLPYFTFLDNSSRKLMHCLIQTQSIDRTHNMTIVKPYLLSISQFSGKMYTPYLKVRGQNGFNIKVKDIMLPKPSKKLVELYEAKKTAFTQQLNQDLEAKIHTSKRKEEKAINPLTKRQQEIADLVIQGLSGKEIAQKLGIYDSTVSMTIQAIERKGIDIKNMKKPKENEVLFEIQRNPPVYNIT